METSPTPPQYHEVSIRTNAKRGCGGRTVTIRARSLESRSTPTHTALKNLESHTALGNLESHTALGNLESHTALRNLEYLLPS